MRSLLDESKFCRSGRDSKWTASLIKKYIGEQFHPIISQQSNLFKEFCESPVSAWFFTTPLLLLLKHYLKMKQKNALVIYRALT